MRSIGELLAEMGFNPDSSVDVQKAFFKHLVKSAEDNGPKSQVGAPAPVAKTPIKKTEPQQLEFNFGDSTPPKKVS